MVFGVFLYMVLLFFFGVCQSSSGNGTGIEYSRSPARLPILQNKLSI